MRERALDELVARVAARLSECGVEHRLIGAAALAAHGVSRSTRDIDLLVADPVALEPATWDGVLPDGFDLEIRRGDERDPLRGVVRVEEQIPDDADWEFVPGGLDLVIVRGGWAARMTRSEGPTLRFGEVDLRAVDAADLVLLKLYAGAARDAWDITALLESRLDRAELIAEVDARVGQLPRSSVRLWRRIEDGLSAGPP